MVAEDAAVKAQQLLLAQLQKQADRLTAEIKAKESGLKDLKETAKLVEAETRAKIQAAKDEYLKEKAALDVAIAPLRGLKQEVEITRAQLVKLAQDKLDKQSGRLSKIETAIQKCKEAVASL
jgi:hypothetical protein